MLEGFICQSFIKNFYKTNSRNPSVVLSPLNVSALDPVFGWLHSSRTLEKRGDNIRPRPSPTTLRVFDSSWKLVECTCRRGITTSLRQESSLGLTVEEPLLPVRFIWSEVSLTLGRSLVEWGFHSLIFSLVCTTLLLFSSLLYHLNLSSCSYSCNPLLPDLRC